jgi:hypothetical protein
MMLQSVEAPFGPELGPDWPFGAGLGTGRCLVFVRLESSGEPERPVGGLVQPGLGLDVLIQRFHLLFHASVMSALSPWASFLASVLVDVNSWS